MDWNGRWSDAAFGRTCRHRRWVVRQCSWVPSPVVRRTACLLVKTRYLQTGRWSVGQSGSLVANLERHCRSRTTETNVLSEFSGRQCQTLLINPAAPTERGVHCPSAESDQRRLWPEPSRLSGPFDMLTDAVGTVQRRLSATPSGCTQHVPAA